MGSITMGNSKMLFMIVTKHLVCMLLTLELKLKGPSEHPPNATVFSVSNEVQKAAVNHDVTCLHTSTHKDEKEINNQTH